MRRRKPDGKPWTARSLQLLVLTKNMGVYQNPSIFISHGRLELHVSSVRTHDAVGIDLIEPDGAVNSESLAFHALYSGHQRLFGGLTLYPLDRSCYGVEQGP